MRHANPGPDSSGIPDSGADQNTVLFEVIRWHALDLTEMMILRFIFNYLSLASTPDNNNEVIVYVAFSHACLFSTPEIFIPDAYMVRKTPENGVDLWRRFLEHVLWAPHKSVSAIKSLRLRLTI